MKIFMYTAFEDMSLSVKIQKDDGEWIILTGHRDDQHMPCYGVELDKGSQDIVIKWLNSYKISIPYPDLREYDKN